jgi:CheY-like chemotaxis protein/HPt (histidine-containing phosphotransfer) domain-containing protein
MGGQITVESRPGKGSTFRFAISLRSVASPPAASETSRIALEGKNVLVVDDNSINRSLLRHLLRKWGMHAVEAENARVALALLLNLRERGEPVDLLLIDVHMPGTDGWTLAEKIRQLGPPPAFPIIMMPSAVARGDADRCRELRIDGYLAKPIVQDELEAAMATVLGGSAPPPDYASLAARKLGTRSGRKLRILVAEDVEVNQKVVSKILERHGHSVVLAANGREAVAAWEREPVDLVFMDIQMPEMDGYQATAEIRAREAGRPRTPIVAMTAYAMTGDAEKCLAAGMDAYVSKPVKGEQILAVLEEFFRGDRPEPAVPAAAPPKDSRPPLDWRGLVEMLDGDLEFARELLVTFLEHLPQQRDSLAVSVEAGDPSGTASAAHKLKGSLQSIKARAAAETAFTMETLGRGGDAASLPAAWEHLDLQLAAVEAEIHGILKESLAG